MFRERLGPSVEQSVRWKWWFLAFLSGQINAGGWLATGRFVSHVTGFATLFGTFFARQQWFTAFQMVTVPVFFLLGTIISGFLVEMKILRGKTPRFDLVMIMAILCLLVCALGGRHDFIGDFTQNFGPNLTIREDYKIMALLCMASGLINSAISSSSAKTVRTTHLTGATTDMGLSLTRWWALRKDRPVIGEKELMLSRFRLGQIVFFTAGSGVATFFFLRYHYLGFLFPAVCASYAYVEARIAVRHKTNFIL